ncbi:transcriptional regulator [bacterium]|nr:transcriptional regulator [bacterium]
MTHPNRILLTIITEASLESKLVQEIESLGAKGHTITDARGKGHRGIRNSDWAAENNIKIEIICNELTAEKIARHVQEKYYEHYAMVLFQHPVSVIRPDKF